MAYKIYSTRTAMRLFREESADLALVHPNMIIAASNMFAAEGDFVAAYDIVSRHEKYLEELRCPAAEVNA